MYPILRDSVLASMIRKFSFQFYETRLHVPRSYTPFGAMLTRAEHFGVRLVNETSNPKNRVMAEKAVKTTLLPLAFVTATFPSRTLLLSDWNRGVKQSVDQDEVHAGLSLKGADQTVIARNGFWAEGGLTLMPRIVEMVAQFLADADEAVNASYDVTSAIGAQSPSFDWEEVSIEEADLDQAYLTVADKKELFKKHLPYFTFNNVACIRSYAETLFMRKQHGR